MCVYNYIHKFTLLFAGFYWNSCTEIMYLTSHGIEIYNVQSEKRQVRSVRQMHQLIHWFVYCPTTSVLIVSPSSKATSTLHLFQIKSSNVYKLPRIDLAFDHSKVEVREKDCHGMSYL